MSSTASASEVILLSDGPQQCSFRIRTHLMVPDSYQSEQRRRSEHFVEVLCDSIVTLRAGTDRIEVATTVDNRALDHRVRVLFPSGVNAKTYFSDNAFDVVERNIALPADNYLRRELAVETTPQQTWTAVSAAKRGLAIISSGQMESTVRDLPGRPIALTLFRATRRTVMTDGQPDGQLQGPLRFQYWIVPFAGTLPRTRLCQLGQHLGAGLRTAQLQPRHFVSIPCEGPRLAPQDGLLEITGDAVCTSICQVDGGIEIRLFNPTERSTTARINPGKAAKSSKPWTKAQPVDLESHPLGKALPLAGGIPLKPKQIVTLSLVAPLIKNSL